MGDPVMLSQLYTTVHYSPSLQKAQHCRKNIKLWYAVLNHGIELLEELQESRLCLLDQMFSEMTHCQLQK